MISLLVKKRFKGHPRERLGNVEVELRQAFSRTARGGVLKTSFTAAGSVYR
jgi:hypothetical protein